MARRTSTRALLALVLSAGCGDVGACGRTPSSETARAETQGEAPSKAGRAFNEPPPEAKKSASGLFSEVLEPGKGGPTPRSFDSVRVDFTAWNARGKETDSSEKRGGPPVFAVSGVIAGWSEALQEMTVGERRRLWVPDGLSYPGRPGPPRPMIVFEIELLEILEGEPPLPAPDDVAAVPKDAEKTPSGLAYRMLERGESRERPTRWDRVTITFAGWSADGTMIDSSQRFDSPPEYEVQRTMPGWEEGLQLLAVGDKARFWIPEKLSYQGRKGQPAGTLVYDITLEGIERGTRPPEVPKDVAAPPPSAKKTPSGLAYRVLQRGEGKAHPDSDARVRVHYTAWTTDGTLVDSSTLRKKPATLPLKRLIPGWSEGMQLLVEGDRARLWIPEKLAYQGKRGQPAGMLVYDVELLEIL